MPQSPSFKPVGTEWDGYLMIWKDGFSMSEKKRERKRVSKRERERERQSE